jgi:hypothetical protein
MGEWETGRMGEWETKKRINYVSSPPGGVRGGLNHNVPLPVEPCPELKGKGIG